MDDTFGWESFKTSNVNYYSKDRLQEQEITLMESVAIDDNIHE